MENFQTEFVMTKARRDYLAELAAHHFVSYCTILMKDESFNGNYINDYIKRSVYTLAYVLEDNDFDSPFEELSLKLSLVNMLLDSEHRIDYYEAIDTLKSIS